jgi:hypothetical protein
MQLADIIDEGGNYIGKSAFCLFHLAGFQLN